MTAEKFNALAAWLTKWVEELMKAFTKVEDYFFHGGVEADLETPEFDA